MLSSALGFVSAAVIAWFVTPQVIRLAKKFGVLAIPRARDIHTGEIPRWGGLAICSAALGGAIVATAAVWISRGQLLPGRQGIGVLVAVVIMLVVGAYDDKRDLRAYWQLLGLAAAGGIVWFAGVRISGFGLGSPYAFHLGPWIPLSSGVSLILTIIWVGTVTKTLDALDGLDGLAIGISIICLATMFIIGHLSKRIAPFEEVLLASTTGACIGFYKYNAQPAQIFVSSSGGFSLGLILAASSIESTAKAATGLAFVVPVLILSVPIADYVVVVTKRILARSPVMDADQRHIHHRLLKQGYSRTNVVKIVYLMTIISCGAAILAQFLVK